MTTSVTTYLFPVATTLEEAVKIRDARGRAPRYMATMTGEWDIRRGWDGYYVVPSGDSGYESVGSLVRT